MVEQSDAPAVHLSVIFNADLKLASEGRTNQEPCTKQGSVAVGQLNEAASGFRHISCGSKEDLGCLGSDVATDTHISLSTGGIIKTFETLPKLANTAAYIACWSGLTRIALPPFAAGNRLFIKKQQLGY